jgi:polyhydroxyalkanoate synthesis repressor PhaR
MTTKPKQKRAKPSASTQDGGQPQPRVIRKYPNRRLYDTAESRYVTLADVRRLVVEGVDFVVVDRKTQQDITRSILLQVIAEQEGAGEAMMSRDFLSHVIRSYGSGLQEFVGRYLDESLRYFAREQRELRDRLRSMVGVDPVQTVAGVAQRNYQRWKAVQDEVMSRLPRPFARDEKE